MSPIANTRRVRYMSPEYAMKDIFSKKSDVYSFGVLLLEFLSGKKNTAWELWKQGDSVELRDNSMASCPKEEHAADRPTISEVISMLTSDIMFLPDPKQPAYYFSRNEVWPSPPYGRLDMGPVNCVSMTLVEAR
ncbi:PREDICTED: G-type lectin S-receptor [Prunus dulcis]|uniref:PREDICTED: G-type lectin S-receptor n=1 Tax=Prunus dulcis TaxID=3755 RepID=A0A5E4E5B3_PRUDU|nr:PREDICTED: G-type lectin S-receptor [Prunus dulcis]